MSVPSNLVPTRISQLPQASTPLVGNELVPVVQIGNTRIVTASGLVALVTLSSISGVPDSRLINTTSGQLTGGGSLAADLTLGLATVVGISGTYGTSSQVPQITVDSYGRVSSAALVTVTPTAIGAVSGTNGFATNITVSGGVLSNVTLSGATYSGETLSGATLVFSTFSGGNVNNATVSGGNLNGVTGSGGTFNSPTISGGTISGATLSGVTVVFSTFSGGGVNNSTISGGNLNNVTGSGGTFNSPTISGGTVSGAAISGAVVVFSTFSGGTVSGGTVITSPTISGGTANAIVIGATTPTSGFFTLAAATTFSGAFSGNAVTATRLATARNFSISSTIGLSSALVPFSGDANVSLIVTGPVTISGGGTGATDAATARTNLSVYSQQETLIFAVALG